MTIIDTTLYCNGELRLSRHGAGRGGDVLAIEIDGVIDQFTVKPQLTSEMVRHIVGRERGEQGANTIFAAMRERYAA